MIKTILSVLFLLVLVPILASCGMGEPESTPPQNEQNESSPPEVSDASQEKTEEPFSVPKDMDEVRANVISYFNALADVKWTCRETMDFSQAKSYTGNLVYNKGTVYYGIPYTSTRLIKASLLEFADALNEKGEYIGPFGFDTLVGGDCGSMRTAWAWGGAVYGVGMNYSDYEFFENPNETRNRTKGFIVPVGTFDFSHYDYYLPFSECIFPYNDIDTMCGSYAELKACDLLGSRFYSGGKVEQHMRMIVEDAFVVRDGSGRIDPEASYIVFSEQTSTPTIVDGKNTTWNLNVKQTFKTLYGDGYVPMTNTCLASGEIAQPVMTIAGENKAEEMTSASSFSGEAACNYNFFAAELTVTDESGNTVIHSKTYPYALKFDVSEMPVEKVPADLPAGKYHYTLTATIGFGTKTLIDLTFSK